MSGKLLKRALSVSVVLAVLPLVATCGSGFPKTVRTSKGVWSSVCPTLYDDVERGAHCAPPGAFAEAPDTRPVCDYREGFCGCEPIGEAGRYVWACRPDPTAEVCPFDRHERPIGEGDACDQVGRTCSYDEGAGCFRSFTCRAGQWAEGALTSRSIAADRRRR